MAIKNWTVTAESVKSASAREGYFHNLKHKNHVNTEAIFDVWGSAKTTLNIIKNAEERKLQTLLKGKGGRPPTAAMEFVLTLPKGPRPSKDEWLQMLKKVASDVVAKLDIPPKELDGIVRAVVHQQRQEGQGTGDHMHLMIGKYTNSGLALPALQKKGVLHVIKTSFNAAVRDVMGLDHETYEAEHKGKPAKKKAPQWRVKAARTQEDLLGRDNAVGLREVQVTMREYAAKEKEDELGKQTKFATALSKLSIYLEKLSFALGTNNDKQVTRQINRANKTIQQVHDEESGITYTPELEAAANKLSETISVINEQVDNRVNPLIRRELK